MSRPAVVFGGPSPEHDVSILTGLQAARILTDAGHDLLAIYWSKRGDFHQVPADLEAEAFVDGVPGSADELELVPGQAGGFVSPGRLGRRSVLDVSAVLNCCHGGPGEDGTLQGLLDLAGLRYTGPSHAGSALGMDKLAFGAVAKEAGLSVLPRWILTAQGPAPDHDGPLIVKPRFGGSSIGIEVVDDIDTARALLRSSPHLHDGAVVEPYLPDSSDLEVAVRTHPELQCSAIARPLRTTSDGQILSYGDKYLGGEGMASTPRELPAEISDTVAKEVTDAARRLVDVAALRSMVRVDFLLDGDKVHVNEVNTIPGSLSLYLWQAAGVAKAEVLDDMLSEAAERPPRQFSTEGADGTALRSAGSIASKLA